jgi:hypothetical protein
VATGQNIADEVRGDLNDGDASNLRWADAELLRYINASARRIATLVPEANVVEEVTEIDNGDVRQTLPIGGIKFFRAWNYDNENSLRGTAITPVELDALSSAFPEWSHASSYPNYLNFHSVESEHTDFLFEHSAHDPRDPKVFYLFPASSSSFYITLQYSKIPTALAVLSDTYPLDDEYLDAAVAYTKYRALGKDGRHGSGPQMRTELYNDFLRALGMKIEADRRVDPGVTRPPGDAHG